MIVISYVDPDGQLHEYEVEIMYTRTADEYGQPRYRQDTVVELIDRVSREVVATGNALLHENDRFDARVGRKIAFERAVLAINDSDTPQGRGIRSQLWQGFLSKVAVR